MSEPLVQALEAVKEEMARRERGEPPDELFDMAFAVLLDLYDFLRERG